MGAYGTPTPWPEPRSTKQIADQGADRQSALAARLTLAAVRRERNELDAA